MAQITRSQLWYRGDGCWYRQRAGWSSQQKIQLRLQSGTRDASVTLARMHLQYCYGCLQIKFITLDIMNQDPPLGRYDVLFCFSVTLWIHINHGDSSLEDFLSKVSSLSKYLVIETQPWKCYRTAARRAVRAGQPPFPHYESLKIRGNVTEFIDNYLTNCCGLDKLAVLGTTGWGRQIIVYLNPHWLHLYMRFYPPIWYTRTQLFIDFCQSYMIDDSHMVTVR